MNNFGFKAPVPGGEMLRNRDFKKAQNRVAVLLFMVTGIVQYVSVVFVPFLMPGIDPFISELTQALLYLAYMALPVFLFGIVNGRGLKGYFSFKRGRKGTVAAGFAALGVVYFAQLVAQFVAIALDSAGADVSQLQPSSGADLKTIILRVVYIAVFAGIFEELVFRGIVLAELLPYGKGFAIVCCGVLFGLMHCNPIQLPFACIVGIVLAYSVVRCGTLWVSVLVHFANNLLSVIFTSLGDYVPARTALLTEAAVTAVIFIAGVIAAVYLIRHKNDPDEQTDQKEKYTAKCVVSDEPQKVDLRGGVFKKISPLLYIYAVFTVMITLSTLAALIAMPHLNEFMEFIQQWQP